jgi:hypothetical protein
MAHATYARSVPGVSAAQGSGDHLHRARSSLYLAAGEAQLARYKGTAFDVYYLMNGTSLLLIALVMLRSAVFSRATAYTGVLAGILMVVPSTAGTVGLVFALASLVPWAVFSVLVARRLLQLSIDAT